MSPWKRGLMPRKSSAASCRSRVKWPLIRPRESTPYAVMPMPSSRAVGRISLLDAAGDQGVLDLQVDDRRDGGGPAQGVRADLGEADVAHVPGLDELGDRADGLLDRDVRVDAGDPVDVDVVAPSRWRE